MTEIDNYQVAIDLVEDLKASLPFSVYPEKRLVKQLQAQGVSVTADQELQVNSILYVGDMGGITFNIEIGKSVCSLSVTHLIMLSDHPLFERVKAYQSHRTRKLMLQDRGGFAAAKGGKKTQNKSQKKKGKGF